MWELSPAKLLPCAPPPLVVTPQHAVGHVEQRRAVAAVGLVVLERVEAGPLPVAVGERAVDGGVEVEPDVAGHQLAGLELLEDAAGLDGVVVVLAGGGRLGGGSA